MHDRESVNRSLYATDNFGETFYLVGEFVKNFFFHHSEVRDHRGQWLDWLIDVCVDVDGKIEID